ncbi:MAG: hypothetical protein LQ349_008835, partial [Xanthoria aureola]
MRTAVAVVVGMPPTAAYPSAGATGPNLGYGVILPHNGAVGGAGPGWVWTYIGPPAARTMMGAADAAGQDGMRAPSGGKTDSLDYN